MLPIPPIKGSRKLHWFLFEVATGEEMKENQQHYEKTWVWSNWKKKQSRNDLVTFDRNEKDVLTNLD